MGGNYFIKSLFQLKRYIISSQKKIQNRLPLLKSSIDIKKNSKFNVIDTNGTIIAIQSSASINQVQKCKIHTEVFKRFYENHSFSKFSTDCNCNKSSQTSNQARHCYSNEIECGVNKQILEELNAGYAYLSMASYFGRSDIALPGCAGFFLKMHEEEMQHAMFFIDYQNMRGGHVELCPLNVPKNQNWEGICQALKAALEMEKDVKTKLNILHQCAEKQNDTSLMDVIAGNFLQEQDRSISEIGRLLTRACKMVNCGVGEFIFDKELYEIFVRKSTEGKEYK